MECLKIPQSTYNHIVKMKHGSVHEILIQCMLIWKNKLECQGQDAVENLQQVQQDIRDQYSKLPTSVIPGEITQPTTQSE